MRMAAAALLAAWLQTAATLPAAPDVVHAEVAGMADARDNDGRFDALTALLREAGLPFAVEPFAIEQPLGGDPRTRGRNVVVSLGQGERTLLVGAHYDASWLTGGALSRGAVDNAASAVLLVHAARALSSERLAARVTFVWFDMEESGLVGSRRYVIDHGPMQGPQGPSLMLNFDINAYGNTILYAPAAVPAAMPLGAAIEHTCADLAIDCVRFAQLPPGDDRSFARAGVPTASFATLPAAEAHHLWLTLGAGRGSALSPSQPPPIMRTIHTTNDTIDKVDGATVLRGAQFAAALIRRLTVN